MRKRQDTTVALPKNLPVLAVLGLQEPAEGDWSRIRGLQYSSLTRATVARFVAHGLAALAVLQLFYKTAHPVVLIGWAAMVVGSLWYGARIDRNLRDADRRRVSPDEMKRQTLSSLANAAAWTVPLAAFTPYGTATSHLELWAICAMLMTASAVLLPAVPLGNVLFAALGHPRDGLAVVCLRLGRGSGRG